MGDTMSDYQQFLNERDKIDYLIQKGYLINDVVENLNGSYVNFFNQDDNKKETVHVGTANARKYFSALLMKQKRKK